jgi:hypothetical protein
VISCEESETPPLAVAERGTAFQDAMQWVKQSREPLLLSGTDGYHMMICLDSSGNTW